MSTRKDRRSEQKAGSVKGWDAIPFLSRADDEKTFKNKIKKCLTYLCSKYRCGIKTNRKSPEGWAGSQGRTLQYRGPEDAKG